MSERLFSEEAQDCAECLAEGFTLDEFGTIRNPGKFESERLWTYHAYHVAMDGLADETTGDEFFGSYQKVGNILLYYRSDGFVDGVAYDSDVDADEAWARIESEYEEFCERAESDA